MPTLAADSSAQRTKKPRPTYRQLCVGLVGRGCEYKHLYYNRESGFLVVGLAKVFSFRPDWHQQDRAKPLVLQYQTQLDLALQVHPELQGRVTRCVHCGIRFLADPQNVGRHDLHCPFGCQQGHRRESARQRSRAFYQTEKGKELKQRLNQRRSYAETSAHGPPQNLPPHPSPTNEPPPVEPPPSMEPPTRAELCVGGVVIDEWSLATSRMLPYVRMLLRVIDGIRLTCSEVVQWLTRILRQRSIFPQRRREYVLAYLQQHPP